jgi:hypothetical protein
MLKQSVWFRPVAAIAALLVLGVVACNAPTEYDVEMGKRLTIALDGSEKVGDEFDAQLAVTQYLESYPGVDQLNVNVRESVGGAMVISLLVWGQDLDAASLQRDLVARFPSLADAEFTIEPLTGTVAGNLGEAFEHAVLDFEVTGETAAEIKAQIMEQLIAQGLDEGATVDVLVDEETGQAEIQIGITEESEDGSQ